MSLFDDLTESMLVSDFENEVIVSDGRARLDLNRDKRKGTPEIIYAERKQPQDTVKIVRRFLSGPGRAIVSRAQPEVNELIRAEFEFIEHEGKISAVHVEEFSMSKMLVVRRTDVPRPQSGGRVGILAAGTSDIPIAEEASVVAAEMGCKVFTVYDVGVAGLHRLFKPLQKLLTDEDVDVIIVAAGMDGALPSVVTGLVSVPVIGLPTSVGYGLGGKGVAALMTMLQTCAPGLTVVNIDNGVGAGATAAMIANRAAKFRASPKKKNG